MDELAKAAGSEEQNATSAARPSPNRRRLVRGAVSIVPLVLTLRSGALAAASFTPEAKTITTLQEERPGKFKLASGSSGLENGDVCFTNHSPGPGRSLSGGNDLKVGSLEFGSGNPGPGRSLSRGTDFGVGSGTRNGAVDIQGGDAFCTGGSYVNGQPVAILSSSTAASLAGV